MLHISQRYRIHSTRRSNFGLLLMIVMITDIRCAYIRYLRDLGLRTLALEPESPTLIISAHLYTRTL